MHDERLAQTALYLFAFSLFLIPIGVEISLALLWLNFFFNPPKKQFFIQMPVLSAGIFSAYCLLQFLVCIGLEGGGSLTTWYATLINWIALISFIPLAWALNGDTLRMMRLLFLASFSLILNMLLRLNWPLLLSSPIEYIQAGDGFGVVAIAFGLYSASVILGFILVGYQRITTQYSHWSIRIITVSVMIFLIQGLLLTQSHAAWLAFLIALFVSWLLSRHNKSTNKKRARTQWIILVAIAVLLTINARLIVQRLTHEASIAQAIMTGHATIDNTSSLGLRWYAHQFGLVQWQQRPWLGWGAGATQTLILNSSVNRPDILTDNRQVWRPLHNSYLELLVQLGVIGLGLFAAIIMTLLLTLWNRKNQSTLPDDLKVFLIVTWVLLLVWSAFDFRALHQDWRAYWSFLAGMTLGVSHRWRTLEMPINHAHCRILLIRLSAIGDIVFATPLITSLRRAYPQAYLAWLVQPEYASLLKNHPDLNAVIIWPYPELRDLAKRGDIKKILSIVGDLKKKLHDSRFDLAIDLQGLIKSGLPTWLSGANTRISLGGKEGSSLLMTHVLPRFSTINKISSEYQYLAQSLKLPNQPFLMSLHIDDVARKKAITLIKTAGLTAPNYIVCCPFTTRPQKHWPEEHWAHLIDRCSHKVPIILLGAMADQLAATRILSFTHQHSKLYNLVGQTDLLTAAAVITEARAVIGVDTGLSHISVALNRPTILLFGATCPYLETEYAQVRILYQSRACSPCRRHPICANHFTCMRELSVNHVMSALTELNIVQHLN
ncbi:O-antigen ligase family protein [Thiospirillum jenense]|uniref:O-antigen ligase family protein n=2 Tax=Thiospirillum jenense TaxID=1653858 RepID=A0A839H7Q0_9GAMM|nr:O-antigen ligase family protein [Thiospirillum jenense]